MKKVLITISILLISFCFIKADEIKLNMTESQKQIVQGYYDSAFHEIESMLQGSITPSFKRAVFVTENAYLENILNYQKYCEEIEFLKALATMFNKTNNLTYSFEDKEDVSKLGAIFYLMTDTINLIISRSDLISHHKMMHPSHPGRANLLGVSIEG